MVVSAAKGGKSVALTAESRTWDFCENEWFRGGKTDGRQTGAKLGAGVA
jgi:hypothetical protein